MSDLDADLPLYDLNCPAARILEDGSAPRDLERNDRWRESVRADQGLPSAALSFVKKSYRLSRALRASGANVVSTFLHKSDMIAALTKLALFPDLRIVANVHAVTSRSVEHLDSDRPEHRHLELIARTLLPRADLVVAVSREVQRDLVDNFGVDPASVVVVPPVLNVERIREESRRPLSGSSGWTEGEVRIVAAGRLVPEKGFDLLVRAVADLAGDLDARLAILGEGPERPRLERLVRSAGLADRVELPGYTPNPWSWMSRAHVYALSSRLEAFPTVLGEAMAVGLPIVAAECSEGVAEYLRDGGCGLLVPPEDPEAMADGIRTVASSPSLRSSFRRRGRKRVEEFRAERVVPRYEAAIAPVVDRAG